MNKFERVMVDIGKGIEYPFKHGAQIVELLGMALKDEPALKDAIQGLIAQIGVCTADGVVVISAKGLDLTADLAEIAAAKALFGYVVNTFLPEVEAVYKDMKPEIDGLTASVDSAPQPGPGLHNVVPA